MKRLFIHPFLVLLMGGVVCGDALILNDGTRVEGKIHKDGDHWVVIDASGNERDISGDDIKSFVLGGPRAKPTPDQALATLRTAADKSSDAAQMVDRYHHFITDNAGTSAADQAQTDLIAWQQRLDNNYAKVGSKWMTQSDRDGLAATEAVAAGRIADLIKQDKLQDAGDLLKQALADDPDDPSANYLNGLLLFAQNQTEPARLAFVKVNKLMPNHGPTLNNLAVVLWKQHQFVQAIADYALAMTYSPVNKTILDNLVEAFHALPVESQSAPPVLKAVALYTQQDQTLAQAQSLKGLTRWGATWVTNDQLVKLKAEEADDQLKSDNLAADARRTQAAIASDDVQINSDEQFLNLQNQRPVVMGGGNYTTLPVPAPEGYVQTQQDLNFFLTAKQQSLAHMDELRNQAGRLQATVSVPKYTGNQNLIGPEGTPIRFDAASGTVPATQPAGG